MQFFGDTNIKFIEKRRTGFIISSILILAGIISLVMHGGPRYNIDFTGGTLVHLKFEKDVEIQQIRSALTVSVRWMSDAPCRTGTKEHASMFSCAGSPTNSQSVGLTSINSTSASDAPRAVTPGPATMSGTRTEAS